MADPSSILHWQNLFNDKTKNVGRVWTDKTVSTNEIDYGNGVKIAKKGDSSEFITSLTALSSTSNLMSTTTTPLDIVLVLDTSSSMTKTMDGTTSKIDALKSAAKAFVGEIAEQNNGVSDEAKQHRVAVVSFNSSATTNQGMTACVGNKAEEIKTTISNLGTGTGTRSDSGLATAQGLLESKREGAKQVVVFFTDGVPTMRGSNESDFDPQYASPAVKTAKEMKAGGATVYTIGVLEEAKPDVDPESTDSNANKFLHAVSSNYPNATYEQKGSSYEWSFGDRAKDSKGDDSTYYKSATNASELEDIFKSISGEITQGASYPTDTEEGKEGASGYITFNDQLGDYMQVTDLSTLVYNGKVHTDPKITTSEDKLVDTYKFSGTVDAGIDHDDLGDIVITVTHSADTDAATGDKVQVKIPASLIPLRNITVDTTKNEMSTNDEMPVSVFYSSGLKPEVAGLLANPDDAMKAYIKDNTGEDGKVNFYANKWKGGTLGDVTAEFNPSTGNSYYYLTQDTPIYTDSNFTTRATSIVSGQTYWYQHTYYENNNGKPVLKTEAVQFPGSEADRFADAIGTDAQGDVYFKKGTAHLISINNLEQVKSENTTKTASDVLNPQWNKADKVSDAKTATAHLGNNGKLSVEKPATLEVKKTVTVPDGYTLSDYANTDFTFNISVPKAAGKSFAAKVLDADGNQVGDSFSLTFDDQGKVTHAIKHGQTLQVFGLDAGWTYEVSETADKLPKGFTQDVTTGATGTFVAGGTSTASFTNKYSATGTLDGKTALVGTKVLTGRDWETSDSFKFTLKNANNEVIDTATVAKADAKDGDEVAFNFSNITYTKPGTYKYQVTEEVPEAKLGGVTYSQAVYQVEVTVSDNGNGTLTATATKVQTVNDKGIEQTGVLAPVETMAFTNSYSDSYDYGANGGLQVSKTLTGRDMAAGEFAFTITGADDASKALLADADRSFTNGSAAAGAANVMKKLASVKFTQADDGKEFAFTVAEVVPEDAQKHSGVTYDTASHEVKIKVTDKHDGTLNVVTTVDGTPGNAVAFTNKYNAQPVSYDASAALKLSKTLTGREWTDSDSFTFNLESLNGAPMPQQSSVAVTKANLEEGKAAISFGSATYTKPGTYEYKVTEKDAGHTIDGVAYSSNVAKFTVKVTDVDAQGAHTGKLVATVTLDSGDATFKNVYSDTEATYDTAAAGIKKVLAGRDWKDSDSFTFKIAAKDGAPLPKDTSGNDVSQVTVNKNNAMNISFGKITFTPEMLGEEKSKEFTYSVTEQKGTAGGITYDEHTATIKVTVKDNGTGNLVTSSDVTDATFTNTYKAETGENPITITANKELTGRSMVAGEFSFGVKYAKDYAAETGDDLFSATNAANGDITFGRFNYSTDSLAQLVKDGYATKKDNSWTVNYMAYENTEGLSGKGITPTTSSVAFTVEVTDYLDGTLLAAMNPEKITFENQYKAESVSLSLSGVKVLEHDAGLTPGDITGKFTFTLSSDDASAPLPEKVTATNDAHGNIAFDKITFTSGTLNGASSKTFTYKVTESGKVAGVTNDKESTKEVRIKVTDDGEGHLTAQFVDKDGMTISGQSAFTFTNTYSVEPTKSSVTDGVEVTKKLTGRDLAKGEFSFELLDTDGNAVATGTNDADGKVELSPLTYTKPGEYHYTLREVNGGKTIDNVTYDSATYSVVATVTDNGKGKLEVNFQIGDLDGLTFNNTYVEPEPDPAPTPEVDPNDPTGGEKVVTTTTTTTTTTATAKTAKTGDGLACIAGVAMVVALTAGAFALLARRFQR